MAAILSRPQWDADNTCQTHHNHQTHNHNNAEEAEEANPGLLSIGSLETNFTEIWIDALTFSY